MWCTMKAVFSVEQFDLLFANSRDAVFFMEKIENDYRYVHLNEAAIKLIDMNPTGKFISQVIPSHISKNIFYYYDLTLEKQEQVEFEDYTYAKMEVRKQRTSTIPVEQNDKSYILAITKEVSMNREIEDKYLFMRSVFFKSFLSTILVSNDMKLLEANPRFIKEFNIHLDEVQDKSLFELPFIDQESVASLKEYLLLAQKGENVTSKMLYFIDKNKERRYFTATFSSLTNNDEIFAVFIILQEITEFVKQGEALRSASHGLEVFKNAISSVADVVFTDSNGVIVDINERVIKNTGYSREELIGQTHNIFNSGHHTKEFFAKLWNTIKSGEIWREEVCNRKKNGEIYWMDSTVIPMKNEHGEIEQFLTIQYNISSEKQLMSELYKIERTFRAITENTNDFIVVTDRFGTIKYASPSYIRKLGYTEEELVGQTYERLLSPQCIKNWREAISQTVQNQLEQKLDLQLRTRENNKIWTEGNYTITLDLTHNEVSEIVMVSREITERKELEDRLTYLAYHDSLTQLGNRRKLYKEFPEIVEKAKLMGTGLAIFYLDGDHFKQVNDVYGHDVGDEFLKNFGQALVKSVRNEDLVVRLGGDEFLIVLTGLSTNEKDQLLQIQHIVERIKYRLSIGWYIQDVHFAPTTSIGIAIYPVNSDSLDKLIDLADKALYKSKQISRNNYCISDVQVKI